MRRHKKPIKNLGRYVFRIYRLQRFVFWSDFTIRFTDSNMYRMHNGNIVINYEWHHLFDARMWYTQYVFDEYGMLSASNVCVGEVK